MNLIENIVNKTIDNYLNESLLNESYATQESQVCREKLANYISLLSHNIRISVQTTGSIYINCDNKPELRISDHDPNYNAKDHRNFNYTKIDLRRNPNIDLRDVPSKQKNVIKTPEETIQEIASAWNMKIRNPELIDKIRTMNKMGNTMESITKYVDETFDKKARKNNNDYEEIRSEINSDLNKLKTVINRAKSLANNIRNKNEKIQRYNDAFFMITSINYSRGFTLKDLSLLIDQHLVNIKKDLLNL